MVYSNLVNPPVQIHIRQPHAQSRLSYKGKKPNGTKLENSLLRLPLRRRPLLVLVRQAVLHPGDGDGGPDAGPEEGQDPADLLRVRYKAKQSIWIGMDGGKRTI